MYIFKKYSEFSKSKNHLYPTEARPWQGAVGVHPTVNRTTICRGRKLHHDESGALEEGIGEGKPQGSASTAHFLSSSTPAASSLVRVVNGLPELKNRLHELCHCLLCLPTEGIGLGLPQSPATLSFFLSSGPPPPRPISGHGEPPASTPSSSRSLLFPEAIHVVPLEPHDPEHIPPRAPSSTAPLPSSPYLELTVSHPPCHLGPLRIRAHSLVGHLCST
jgi:hypothetical protein